MAVMSMSKVKVTGTKTDQLLSHSIDNACATCAVRGKQQQTIWSALWRHSKHDVTRLRRWENQRMLCGCAVVVGRWSVWRSAVALVPCLHSSPMYSGLALSIC